MKRAKIKVTATEWVSKDDLLAEPPAPVVETPVKISKEEGKVFIGWCRHNENHPWKPVVKGNSEAEALNKLLSQFHGGDKMVLREGRHPDDWRNYHEA